MDSHAPAFTASAMSRPVQLPAHQARPCPSPRLPGLFAPCRGAAVEGGRRETRESRVPGRYAATYSFPARRWIGGASGHRPHCS